MSASSSSLNVSRRSSLWSALQNLLRHEMSVSDVLGDDDVRRLDGNRLLATLRWLEPLVLLGVVLCIDITSSFIFVTPLKAVLSALLWLVRGRRPSPAERRHLLASLLLLSCALCVQLCNSLLQLSYSHFYHLIRRQSYFKVGPLRPRFGRAC
jgi:hypothetical protein